MPGRAVELQSCVREGEVAALVPARGAQTRLCRREAFVWYQEVEVGSHAGRRIGVGRMRAREHDIDISENICGHETDFWAFAQHEPSEIASGTARVPPHGALEIETPTVCGDADGPVR